MPQSANQLLLAARTTDRLRPFRASVSDPMTVGLGPGLIGVAAIGVLILVATAGSGLFSATDDLVQLAAAGAAAAASAAVARQSSGRLRWSWTCIAGGCLSWALGQAVWCYYELVAVRPAPYPSLADAGYLLFQVGAVVGLLLFPTQSRRPLRRLLDAFGAATALLVLSWTTALHAVVAGSSWPSLATGVSLAYPIGDAVVVSMVLVTVIQRSAHARTLVLLSVGLASMAVADSGFVYLTATARYHTGDWIDLAWILAFLVIVAAAVAAPRGRGGAVSIVEEPPRGVSVLPYLPLGLAAAVLCVRTSTGEAPDAFELTLTTAAVGLLLLRQCCAVVEISTLFRQVTAREEQLRQETFYDPLTGLANRRLFVNRVVRSLEQHERDDRPFAVLICDLDDFKAVNDTFGHDGGDQLLVQVAERLVAHIGPSDTLARLGGDEFAVLAEDADDPTGLAERLVKTLGEPFLIAGVRLTTRISIGVTVAQHGQPPQSLRTMLSQADVAMYAAKRTGRGQVKRYRSGMTLPETEDLLLAEPLRRALEREEIVAHYQPVVDLDTGALRGFEALARWSYDGRQIPPPQLVAVAKRTGLLARLTATMLDQACGQLAEWSRQVGHDELKVAVNIPPDQVVDLDLPRQVAAAINRHGLRAGQVVVEITEDGLLSDLDAARRVTEELREVGVLLALDDFGTGYSSLAHLHKIPLTNLKIDRAFVVGLDEDPRVARFITAILRLADSLALGVVVEGVETAEQARTLHLLGCRMAQGYHFGRPARARDVDLSRAQPSD